MSTTENKPFSVVPMLDGRFALIECIVGKDDRTAIHTAVFFESEQAAEAWRKDRRAGKAEECPLPRETGALIRPQARTHRAPFGRGDPPRMPGDLEQDTEWCQELTVKCKAGFERFDRRNNYEQDGDDVQHVLKVAPIAARLGVMMSAFMNPTTQSPELFGRAMVEQVADIDGLSMVALETACREIEKTEKWPDIPKVVDVVRKHVDEWRGRRRAVYMAERVRLELIPILIEREQKKQKETREREIKKAQFYLRDAMATTQRVAKEIEEAKAKLAKLMQVHHVAEQRESGCLRALRKLTMTEEEQEAQAIAKANGAGCAELRLMPPRAPYIEAKSERERLSGARLEI